MRGLLPPGWSKQNPAGRKPAIAPGTRVGLAWQYQVDFKKVDFPTVKRYMNYVRNYL